MVALGKLTLLASSTLASGTATSQGTSMTHKANPIRKVVTLLQKMQKKVTAEGEEAEKLFEKFMCYCQSSSGDLAAGIQAATEKIPQLAAAIKSAEGKKTQLEADLKGHQKDRTAAEAAISEAEAIRKKEKTAFDKFLADSKDNLAATNKAVAAIEQGMGSSFLQSSTASSLRSIISANENMAEADRSEVLSFLSGQQSEDYAPASGEIVGILKTMADEMAKAQEEAIAAEEASVKDSESLITAKKKEVSALSNAIEQKMTRVGEIGVQLATMENDMEDTEEALGEDKAFAADMKKQCAEKTDIHEKEKIMRGEELTALGDTIKILNDDDALDIFKKTLPSASSSFMQVQESSTAWRSRAVSLLQKAMKPGHARRVSFILLALRGKKVGFDKILKLIDNLVATLKKEQVDDNEKKEYCEMELDMAEDKKKDEERVLSDIETVIAESKEGIAKLTEEIDALTKGIKDVDKQVAEATENRKAETAEFKELMKSDGAAKELLLFAKNRLNKFYAPKLAKAALTQVDDEGEATSFVQLSRRGAPPPPPETADAYKKKAGESGGVIAMIDLLVADLEKEMTTAKVDEKNAQAEYEQTIKDSSEKRAQDSKSLTDKEAAKADLEGAVEDSVGKKKASLKELMGLEKYLGNLHSECDWLLKYFDVRKTARTDEIDALTKAKAVLSGADFSLVQVGHVARRNLRHA